MRLLTRSLLWQLLVVFLTSLGSLSLLLVFVGVVRESISNGVTGQAILRMVPFVVPLALRVSIPLTVLLAASSVYGRMSADREVVAIKSLGISPVELFVPAWVFAILVSLVAVCMNDLAVSWGRLGVQRVLLDSVEQIAYRRLRMQGMYNTPRLSLHVAGVDGRRLLSPVFEIRPRGGTLGMRVVAREAELRRNPQTDLLEVVITDGRFERRDGTSYSFRDSHVIPIPLLDAIDEADRSASPSSLAMRAIPRETSEQQTRVRSLRTSIAATLAHQWTVGNHRSVEQRGWDRWRRDLTDATNRLHRLHTEPWRRWANGFSCFCFVVVAAPLAVLMRNANFFTTFAACFFPILVVYYPLLAYSVDRAKDGALPPISVWLGNVVLLLAGAWFVRRVVQH